jgi:hypothetical protein
MYEQIHLNLHDLGIRFLGAETSEGPLTSTNLVFVYLPFMLYFHPRQAVTCVQLTYYEWCTYCYTILLKTMIKLIIRYLAQYFRHLYQLYTTDKVEQQIQ